MKLCSLNCELDIYFYNINKFIRLKTLYSSKSEYESEQNDSESARTNIFILTYVKVFMYLWIFCLIILIYYNIHTQQEYISEENEPKKKSEYLYFLI